MALEDVNVQEGMNAERWWRKSDVTVWLESSGFMAVCRKRVWNWSSCSRDCKICMAGTGSSTTLNVFFRLVKHLLWKLNQTQPTKIYLDVSVSIRGLRQKKMKLILLLVLATIVMWVPPLFLSGTKLSHFSTKFFLTECHVASLNRDNC